MQEEMRDPNRADVDQATLDMFTKAHAENKLLQPERPGHVIAALSVLGTRSEPTGSQGGGLGAEGAFVNWNAPELSDDKWQWQG